MYTFALYLYCVNDKPAQVACVFKPFRLQAVTIFQRNLPDAPVFQQALAMELFERVQGSLGRLDHSQSVGPVCLLSSMVALRFVCVRICFISGN